MRFPKASGYGHTHSGMDVRPHDFTSACHWPIGRSVRPVDTVAQDRIIGVGSVIDGDTIEIHGQRIRLFGIDAPESSQLCIRVSGERWRCGQQASFALADRIGRASVSCRSRDIDRYGRVIAVCFKGSEDLSRWMVANGWAVAYRHYSENYVAGRGCRQTKPD